MEQWDLYDGSRHPLNKTHIRGNDIAPGEYHIVVEIWTVNSKGEILLTLRHPKKEIYPNLWENTGGSVLAGESSKEGAVRELKEETGIEASESELIFLGTTRAESVFFDTYVVNKDIPIEKLTMQEGETVSAQWVTLKELDDIIKEELLVSPLAERFNSLREKFENFVYMCFENS